MHITGLIRGGPSAEVRERGDALIEALDLTEWRDTLGTKLSGGVRRLVGYIMTTVWPGKVVILDEPTNDVDPRRRRLLWDQIRLLGSEGAAVFLEMAAEARSKIDAEDFTLYYNVGVANYSMRAEDLSRVDVAIMYYEKALDVQPDEPQTIFNIVVAYVSKEDWREAIQWGEKYVSVSPDDPRGWQLLARCYSETGDRDKAREALTRFETLHQGG